jgi:hypothetical protein
MFSLQTRLRVAPIFPFRREVLNRVSASMRSFIGVKIFYLTVTVIPQERQASQHLRNLICAARDILVFLMKDLCLSQFRHQAAGGEDSEQKHGGILTIMRFPVMGRPCSRCSPAPTYVRELARPMLPELCLALSTKCIARNTSLVP